MPEDLTLSKTTPPPTPGTAPAPAAKAPAQDAGETVTVNKADWEKTNNDLAAMAGRLKKIEDEGAEKERKAAEEKGEYKALYEREKTARIEQTVTSKLTTALVGAGVSTGHDLLTAALRPLVKVSEDGTVDGVDAALEVLKAQLPGAFGKPTKTLSKAPGGDVVDPGTGPTAAQVQEKITVALKEGRSPSHMMTLDRELAAALKREKGN